MQVQSATQLPVAVAARHLGRRFGAVIALDDVTLDIHRGEYFSLLGPSGCGKTTFLRIIAGLERPDAGSLAISGADALPVPAHQRHVNTVFQSYALFPHMTVHENVAFGLRMKKLGSSEIKERLARVLDMAHIGDLRSRKPHQLSGGQRQRVALARAIVNEPDVLLLDEPLAALDVKLRRQLQDELRSLQRRLGITFIHVTHDQDEAISLSDRIAVMNAGRIVQVGTASEIYERPRNRFVAGFVGGCNLLPARKVPGQTTVLTPIGELHLADEPAADALTVAVRPEKIVCGSDGGNVNRVRGKVVDTTYLGAETHLSVATGDFILSVAVFNRAGAAAAAPGDAITLTIPPEALLLLEDS